MNSIVQILEAKTIWSGMVKGIEGGEQKPLPWLGRMVKMGAGILGAGLFFGSFGLLAMPLVGGWSWLGAGVAFIGTQYASQVLLDLPEYWNRAGAYILIVKLAVKGKVKDGINNLVNEVNAGKVAGA